MEHTGETQCERRGSPNSLANCAFLPDSAGSEAHERGGDKSVVARCKRLSLCTRKRLCRTLPADQSAVEIFHCSRRSR